MMKRVIKMIAFLVVFIHFGLSAPAQTSDPGDPGGDPETGDPPLGGGAPVGGGTLVLLSLVMVYTGVKTIKYKNSIS